MLIGVIDGNSLLLILSLVDIINVESCGIIT